MGVTFKVFIFLSLVAIVSSIHPIDTLNHFKAKGAYAAGQVRYAIDHVKAKTYQKLYGIKNFLANLKSLAYAKAFPYYGGGYYGYGKNLGYFNKPSYTSSLGYYSKPIYSGSSSYSITPSISSSYHALPSYQSYYSKPSYTFGYSSSQPYSYSYSHSFDSPDYSFNSGILH